MTTMVIPSLYALNQRWYIDKKNTPIFIEVLGVARERLELSTS